MQEFNNGALAGVTFAEADARYPALANAPLPHEPVPDGESEIAFRARAEMLWSRLLVTLPPEGRHLLVAHGGIINRLFRAFLELPMHTGVRLITGDTGMHRWQIDGETRRVVFANASPHLPPVG